MSDIYMYLSHPTRGVWWGTAISSAKETNTFKMNEGKKILFTASSAETQYMGECCELTPS